MTNYLAHKISDHTWVVASNQLVAPEDGLHEVVRIPPRCLVKNIWLDKKVAFGNPTSTAQIGFIGNGETADPNAFFTVTLNTNVMESSLHSGTGVAAAGKYFDQGGLITITTDKDNGTAGTLQVFVEYVQLTN